jgi:hypothetical protein
MYMTKDREVGIKDEFLIRLRMYNKKKWRSHMHMPMDEESYVINICGRACYGHG